MYKLIIYELEKSGLEVVVNNGTCVWRQTNPSRSLTHASGFPAGGLFEISNVTSRYTKFMIVKSI